MKNLIKFENNFASTDPKGGSTFNQAIQDIHTGVGVAFDAENLTFSQATATSGTTAIIEDQLKDYDVGSQQGNNISVIY